MKAEGLNSPALDFTLIGSGEVVGKYWLRSEAEGLVRIPNIVSLEPEKSFRQRNPTYKGGYYQTRSLEETVSRVISLTQGQNQPNIGLATPAEVRLVLATEILSNSNQARLLIEKPYASTKEGLDEFGNLIQKYFDRLHLTGRYGNSRADILYPHLPERRVPSEITGRLIEGTQYFEIVKRKFNTEGNHQYLTDGPELDLGFHLMDIIGVGSQRFGGIKTIQINYVCELSQVRRDFEKHYGFGAKLVVTNSSGDSIIVDLQAGKADAPNERFIEFNYGDLIIGQEYTTGDSIDPVYILRNSSRQTVSQHPSGYNDYAQELQPSVFCHQSRTQQLLSLANTALCLDIKERRQALTV